FLGFLRMREWRELHRQLKLQCAELGWREEKDTGALLVTDAPPTVGTVAGADAAAGLPGAPSSRRRGGRGRDRGRSKAHAPEARAREGAVAAREAAARTDAHAAYVRLHRALIAGLPTQL